MSTYNKTSSKTFFSFQSELINGRVRLVVLDGLTWVVDLKVTFEASVGLTCALVVMFCLSEVPPAIQWVLSGPSPGATPRWPRRPTPVSHPYPSPP